MKKLISCILVAIVTIAMAACSLTETKNIEASVAKSGDVIAITVASADEGATLVEAMRKLKAKDELDFTMSGLYVASIDGKENAADYSSYWALFTTDMEKTCYDAEQSWSYYEYNGKLCGYSNYGAESLQIKAGETYVWVYTVY
ncbi:MAG: DUF4430 domain-containing protein, partial [Clostridia bacterium]|nr:DUF4430 domain-containing protein [Clostridia bacterium]